MKTLELFFNPDRDPQTSYETWCFEPGPQEKELGHLYLIAELKSQNTNTLDFLASGIRESYSHSGGDFTQTVKSADKRIKERGLNGLDIAILAIKKRKLKFAKTKGARVSFARSRQIINIGSKLKSLNKVGSIQLELGDELIASTNEAWKKLRQKHLISKTLPYSKTSLIRNTLEQNVEVSGATLIILINKERLNFLKNLIASPSFPRLSSPVGWFKDWSRPRIDLSGFQLKSTKLFRKPVSRWNQDSRRRITILIVLLLLLVLIGALLF